MERNLHLRQKDLTITKGEAGGSQAIRARRLDNEVQSVGLQAPLWAGLYAVCLDVRGGRRRVVWLLRNKIGLLQ